MAQLWKGSLKFGSFFRQDFLIFWFPFDSVRFPVWDFVSPVTSKPATKGRIKTSHSEVLYSYLDFRFKQGTFQFFELAGATYRLISQALT